MIPSPVTPVFLSRVQPFGGGLSEGEAARQLTADGPNELPGQEKRPWRKLLIETFSEPMVAILLGCGGIYLFLGDRGEALLLVGFLILILVITLYQETKAEKALTALRNLSSPRALVWRDHEKKRIAGRDVVRGDLVILAEGDRVPADGWLLEATGLTIDESLLTGESEPVLKQNHGGPAEDYAQIPAVSKVFAGTSVLKGSGLLRVKQTGLLTELGRIGTLLKDSTSSPTKMEVETRHLVQVVAVIASLCCLLVAVLYAWNRGSLLAGLLAGLTLAMAILPNELPAVLTIFLSLGAWRLSKQRILTRRSSAIEALGAADVLCVDKTGTLTYNRMSLRTLYVDGVDYDIQKYTARDLPEEVHQLIEFGILAGDKDPLDPIDRALHQVGQTYLSDTEHLHADWALARHYPFSRDLFALSYVWNSDQKKPYAVAAKGAPEAIIDLCHLTGDKLRSIQLQVETLAAQGLRLIAVAKAEYQQTGLPDHPHAFDFEFVGILGLEDPIRREVPQAIAECHRAGIRVMMITGDHPRTACSIAQQIGLPHPDRYLLGEELKSMSDEELLERLKTTHIFARVIPEQKLRLVRALKAQGATVAMTGDGVNDAPALKEAHIGIAMGQRGTDVAREAADLVLLDDDFASIVASVRMGRRIYGNLQSAIAYLLAVHIPIAGISIIPLFFDMPLILTPIHVALLHLVIEPACSVAFEAEPSASHAMAIPPRPSSERLFSRTLMLPTLAKGLSVLLALLAVFFLTMNHATRGHANEGSARTLTFLTLMSANMGLIAAHRLGQWRLKGRRMRTAQHNPALSWVLALSAALIALGLYAPGVRNALHFAEVRPQDVLLCLTLGLISSLWPQLFVHRLPTAHGEK